MTSRSVNSIVTFAKPFAIGAQPEKLPAGAYNMTSEEELIEGLSFAAYHRTSTILEVPAIGTVSTMKQYLQIAAGDIEAALQSDRPGAEAGTA
jgi:hypothetical protein